MQLLIVIGGIIVLALVVAFIQDLRVKRHTGQLQEQAERLGLSFSEEGEPPLYSQVQQFLLFSLGQTGEIKNQMQGVRPLSGEGPEGDTVDVALFEYTFTTPLGRYTRNWIQTTLHIRDDALDLPGFFLTPEPVFNVMLNNVRDKEVRERLGSAATVRFPAHPDFEEAMHVQGPDRVAIQALFSDTLIDLLMAQKTLCIEGNGASLLFYRFDEKLPSEEIPAFLDTALAAHAQYRETATQETE